MKKKVSAVLTAATVAVLGGAAPAAAAPVAHTPDPAQPTNCAPAARAVSFGDSLNKLVRDGVTVGGLSSIAWDRRTASFASTVDNHATDPARIWFWRDPANPVVTCDPLVLRRPDGSAYDGVTADDEGLAILPDGDFVVSSETEPAIRIFGRDGVQKASLPVPARFAVTPAGQATANATLEGLTVTPDGTRLVAAMEGALSGDTDPTLHRFLVYDRGRAGTWKLTRQLAYRAQPGLRIPEISAYDRDSLLVEEAAFDATTGNTVQLYAVRGISRAADVTPVADLAAAPAADVLTKSEVADLVTCPTLGATSPEPQVNPLLDNYEGMTVRPGRHGRHTIELISDDNFSATQVTRVLTLTAKLP